MTIKRAPSLAERLAELDARREAIKDHQRTLLRYGIWRSCLNCNFWNHTKELCDKFKAVPPPDTIVHSCRDWEDDIPF